MKKRVLFLISAVLLLSACGTTARYSSSQRFQDGIYVNRSNTIADRQAAAAEKQEIDTLIAQTKNSEIYLLEDESATITVPGDISANTSITVKNNTGATVTIGEDAVLWQLEMVKAMVLQLMVLERQMVLRHMVLGMELDCTLLRSMVLGRMV